MSFFRAYARVRIENGKFESFTSMIPDLISIVKAHEPEAVQCEAFACAETQEVVWLMSFTSNEGFDLHLTNTALDEVRAKIMPMQEEIKQYFFMSQPTEFTLKGLESFGMNPTILKPLSGTNKLTEQRASNNVQTIALLDVNDVDAFNAFFTSAEQVAANHSGFLFHRAYQVNAGQVLVYSEWAHEESMLAWSTLFGQKFAEAFKSQVAHLDMIGCGTLSDQSADLLSAWDAPVFTRVAGFTRYQQHVPSQDVESVH